MNKVLNNYQQTIFKTYRDSIVDIFDKTIENSSDAVAKTAQFVAKHIADGNVVHIVPAGLHANVALEEVFWRAGGLAPLNPLFYTGFNLIQGAKVANYRSSIPGYARQVYDTYDVGKKEGEVVIILSAFGINTASIDLALEAKRRKMTTIGITSTVRAEKVSKEHPGRHPSKENLCDISDYFIDCHPPYNDTVIDIPGFSQQIGTTTSFCLLFSMNLLMISTINELVNMGVEPPLWRSVVLAADNEVNHKLEEQYMPYVKHLARGIGDI